MPDEKQDVARERLTVMLTADEKRAVRVVAGLLRITESELMRDKTVTEIMAEYERLRAATEQAA